MSSLRYLHNFPFLLFLFPFVLGIVGGDFLFSHLEEISFTPFIIFFLISFFLLIYLSKTSSYNNRWIFGGIVFLFFLTLGTELSYNHLSDTNTNWSTEEVYYSGTLQEKPKEKEKTLACRIRIEDKYENSRRYFIDKESLVYLIKDSIASTLLVGDKILFYGRISSPLNNGNHGEFNYARYLLRKGVSGTGVIYTDNWQLIARKNKSDIKSFALQVRENLLEYYRKAGITQDEFAILSALTLGYKDELSEEVKQSHSVAGTSHILALSGLHMGIIFSFLLLFSGFFGKSLSGRIIRIIIFLFCLWGFAFISGLSPSVVRSVCMFTCLIFFQFLNKRHLSLHILSITAFGMLLYNPFYLYDISFQLSFTAVTSILIITPRLQAKISFNSKPGNYIRDLLIVSFAAQLGTFPLILYYFHSFPTYFLLANLLVVPLAGAILYLALIFWTLFLFPVLQHYFSVLLVLLIKLLNMTVMFIGELSFSSIDRVVLTTGEVIGLYIVILLITFYSSIRKKGWVIVGCLSVLLLFSFNYLLQNLIKEEYPSITFYNTSSVAVHLREPGLNSRILLYNKNNELPSHLQNLILQNSIKEKAAFPEIIHLGEAIEEGRYIFYFHNTSLCFLIDDYWNEKKTDLPLSVDYLYISSGFTGNSEDISKLFHVKNIVYNSSVRDVRIDDWRNKSQEQNIPFYLLKEGALYIPLSMN